MSLRERPDQSQYVLPRGHPLPGHSARGAFRPWLRTFRILYAYGFGSAGPRQYHVSRPWT